MDDYQSSAMAQQEVKAVGVGRKPNGKGPTANGSQVPVQGPGPSSNKVEYFKCWRCERTNHPTESCCFKEAQCYNCQEIGYIRPMCPKNVQGSNSQAHAVTAHTEAENFEPDSLDISNTLVVYKSNADNPYVLNIDVNGVKLPMEIDTGASISLIPYAVNKDKFRQGLLKGPPAKLELVDGAQPKCSKAYRMPIALQSTVDYELDRLVNEGILKPVEHFERVLSGIDGIHIYDDNILVVGWTIEELSSRLELVFKSISNQGLKPKRSKCAFLQSEVKYLGHIINDKGIKTVLLTQSSGRLSSLTALLENHVKFEWSVEADQAFQLSKQLVRTSELLVQFDPNKPVKLTCDASRVGMAAVLSHTINGEERPIQFASQKLNSGQTMYPQIEREGLAIVFGLEKNELSVMLRVLMRGIRVVVPEGIRIKLLHELHIGHLGMSKIKSIARSIMWWPNIDQDIESTSKACEACMVLGNNPKAATVHPWLPTSRPYQRVYIEYAGPVEGDNMLLVIVDSYSKWPEVCITKSTTSTSTINMLRSIFSRWGIPEELVSDNGPQFTSAKFEQFAAHLGIRHKRGAPLNKFLMAYRNAPHSVTGQSPAQLMMGRFLRTRLDCLKPVIGSKQSPLIPVVEGIVVDGRVWKRHVDHLKNCVQKADSILPNVGSRPDISELASDQLPLYYRTDEYFLNSDVECLPDFTQVNSPLPASTQTQPRVTLEMVGGYEIFGCHPTDRPHICKTTQKPQKACKVRPHAE
ncbi:uncharacterized protein [Watersipora subatra]|uniref:uncharacterized protein n=1 Tax=Watersipora subatra TaxID=2589382 RepID=UPI00355BED4C